MNIEYWRPVVGYEGLYEVSNKGRVRSLDRYIKDRNGNYTHFLKGRILSQATIRKGYKQVQLSKDGTQTPKRVHRLVAEAFIPNPLNLPQINHKDCNPSNNSVENLEWCDAKYNSNYGDRTEKVKIGNINNPSKSKRVNQFDLDGVLLKTWPSLSEAARIYSRTIGDAVRGRQRTSNGFVWRYAE